MQKEILGNNLLLRTEKIKLLKKTQTPQGAPERNTLHQPTINFEVKSMLLQYTDCFFRLRLL